MSTGAVDFLPALRFSASQRFPSDRDHPALVDDAGVGVSTDFAKSSEQGTKSTTSQFEPQSS